MQKDRDRKEEYKKHKIKCRNNNVCIRCGKDKGNSKYDKCKKCNDERKIYYKKNNELLRGNREKRYNNLKNKGLCTVCGKEEGIIKSDGTNKVFCEMCNIGSYASKYKINKNELKYKLIIEQERKCPYTGIILTVGINAELDHIKPISRFPELKNNIDNMQWILDKVNKMKLNLTHEEFVMFCKMISEKY